MISLYLAALLLSHICKPAPSAGLALEFADEPFKADREIVVAAVAQDGLLEMPSVSRFGRRLW